MILEIIQRLGVRGGTGYAYEYAGDTVDRMTMDERMTMCNMSIEGGARVGYVNPDETTFEYLKGRPFTPQGDAFERAKQWWRSIASDADAAFDDEVVIQAAELKPIVTWGVNPGQSIAIDEQVPSPDQSTNRRRSRTRSTTWGSNPGRPIAGMKVDVAFIGSCTNARLSDLREAARIVKGRHVAAHVKALVVPGFGRRQQGRRARRAGGRVPRGRLRVARRRLLDVPRHESRQAPGQSGVRRLVEQELQGTAGKSHRADAADESGDGGGRCGRGQGRGRAGVRELMGAITGVRGRATAAARRRHRYRSDHARRGSSSASASTGSSSTCSRTIAKPPFVRTTAIRSTSGSIRARRFWW